MQDTNVVENLVKNGKHFCVLPWVHFHSWPDGRVMPCCIADSNMPVAEIKKDESIIQMMNSEDYKKMRSAMLNDEPVEACKRCYDLELMGTWTMRQSHNKRRGLEYAKEIADATKDDGEITDFKMKYMDLRFSNMCNMKCRSCGPGCSSLWAQEFVDERGPEVYEQYFKTKKIVINKAEEVGFMNKLKPYLKDVTEVYFAGGEIIITPEHYECLDYWIENGLNEQIELTYTTNLGSLKYKDKDLIGYWKKFPQLKIWASLDAMGDTAEVIRKGTDWERIVKNIRAIKEQVPHAQFQITPTISIWNVFHFPDFFDYMIEQGFIDTMSSPRFNLATNPWYANIMILPVSVKRRLAELYRVYQNKYKDNIDIYNGFKMIIYNLTVGDENKGGILEFKQFNDELDQFRDEKFEDICPEIKEVYAWAKS
jgi:MoaA/NifB/PqqE/SkfB family radical SAM enzyme